MGEILNPREVHQLGLTVTVEGENGKESARVGLEVVEVILIAAAWVEALG